MQSALQARFPLLGVGDDRFPKPFAGFEIIGENASVLRTAEEPAVEIGGAAAHELRRRGLIVFVGTPVLAAIIWIYREDIECGGEDQSTLDLQQAAIKPGILARVIGAQNLQITGIDRGDLVQRRKAI
jgi:hypothetical protein